MSYYNELTTVNAVRSSYLAIVGTGDDTLMLDIIRSVSNDIAHAAHRAFSPRVETRYFDYRRDVDGAYLYFDADLLDLTTLTNGDSTTISSAAYVFEPRNMYPRYALKLINSSGVYWTYNQDTENAISIAGVWGYHTDYGNAWQSVDTLAANATSNATSITTTGSALIKPGQLLKIDSEYLYASAVSTTTTTVSRGANGSTAASHSNGATIYAWTPDAAIEQLAKEASAARFRMRENPIAETIVIDGQTFSTPKDIGAYIQNRLTAMGVIRAVL